uniref:DUF7597 domain-containing protein n=1 Tax=Oryza meridionalis TaxID=40149 RepID=A0A0E0DBN4_9ORYZ
MVTPAPPTGWDFSPGDSIRDEVWSRFGSPVHFSSHFSRSPFRLVGDVPRSSFRLTPSLVALALRAAIGGSPSDLQVDPLIDRSFTFVASSVFDRLKFDIPSSPKKIAEKSDSIVSKEIVLANSDPKARSLVVASESQPQPNPSPAPMANTNPNPHRFLRTGQVVHQGGDRVPRIDLSAITKPTRSHEEYAIALVEPILPEELWDDHRILISEYIEQVQHFTVRRSFPHASAVGLFKFGSAMVRDLLVYAPPFMYDGILQLEEWYENDSIEGRVLVRAMFSDFDSVLRKIVLQDATRGARESWTISIFTLEGDFADVFPPDEDLPPAGPNNDGNPDGNDDDDEDQAWNQAAVGHQAMDLEQAAPENVGQIDDNNGWNLVANRGLIFTLASAFKDAFNSWSTNSLANSALHLARLNFTLGNEIVLYGFTSFESSAVILNPEPLAVIPPQAVMPVLPEDPFGSIEEQSCPSTPTGMEIEISLPTSPRKRGKRGHLLLTLKSEEVEDYWLLGMVSRILCKRIQTRKIGSEMCGTSLEEVSSLVDLGDVQVIKPKAVGPSTDEA